jgi:hypothetical protein
MKFNMRAVLNDITQSIDQSSIDSSEIAKAPND